MEDNKITSIQFENGLLIFEMEIDGSLAPNKFGVIF